MLLLGGFCGRSGQKIPRQLRVFLCHPCDDKPAVRKLYRQLHKDGVDPWLDTEELLPGQHFPTEIRTAMADLD